VGPTVREGTIVLDRIDGPDDLPRGVGEEQEAGTYRLIARDDDRVLWAHGPDSAKRFLFPARETVATLRRTEGAAPDPGDRGARDCRRNVDDTPRRSNVGVGDVLHGPPGGRTLASLTAATSVVGGQPTRAR
jgi:sulfhydrogenase subunit beta (sulfur reductase)